MTIMRGQRALEFPANAMLVAACNRCPCGRAVDRCTCAAADCDRYLRRLSGPLLDRLDLVCQVEPRRRWSSWGPAGGAQRRVRERVMARGSASSARLAGTGALCNGDMDGRLTRREVPLDAEAVARLIGARARRSQRPRARPRAPGGADHRRPGRPRRGCATSDVEEALAYRLDGWEQLAA